MESEKLTEKYLVKRVKAVGGISLKNNSSNQKGVPDRMILFKNNKIGFLELKSENKKPTKLQAYWLGLLSDLGFKTGVADTKEKVDQFIEELINI